MIAPLGVAQALGHRVGDVRVRQRLLELGDGGVEERRVPFEVRMRRGLLDLGHGGSLFRCRGRESNPHGREAGRF